MFDVGVWNVLKALFIGGGIRAIARTFYRLYLHPLANFPGPMLAAASDYYIAYYDICKGGAMVKQLEKLHKMYGEASLNEDVDFIMKVPLSGLGLIRRLHFNDPRAYNQIYTQTKTIKYAPFYDCFQGQQTSFGFIDPKLAKRRKEILAPLFSRRAILKFEDVVQYSIDRLIDSLSAYAGHDSRPADLHMALHSVTMEIITSYCHGNPWKTLDYPNFDHPALVAVQSVGGVSFIIQHFPFIRHFIFCLPDSMKSPEMIAFDRLDQKTIMQIDDILADPSLMDKAIHETIYHHLLSTEGGRLPPSRESLIGEARVLIFAGSETVADACGIGIFHVLKDHKIRRRLVEEIKGVWPDKNVSIRLQILEKLPYLTAVIKESLRFSHGVVNPLPRVIREDALIDEKLIPAGTIVGIGHTFVHQNPDIFENPLDFNPDRWLGDKGKELDGYMVAFSRGPRMCLGINLAWCELYLIFGNLFRRLEMELYNTTAEDFDFAAFFTPKFRGHLRVLVREAEQ